MLRLGLKTPMDMVPEVYDVGFDFLELPLREIAALTDAEFNELREYLAAIRVRVDVLSDMLPDDMKLTGNYVRANIQHEYLDRAFARASRLGAKVIAFDAAKARSIPAGFDFQMGRRQVGNFLRIVQGHAAVMGLKVGIVNLRYNQSNLVNTVSEAALMAALLQQDRLAVLADVPNLLYCQEQLEALSRCGSALVHVHLGHPLSRRLPHVSDGEDYGRVFAILSQMGYMGALSVVAERGFSAGDAANALYLMNRLRQQYLV